MPIFRSIGLYTFYTTAYGVHLTKEAGKVGLAINAKKTKTLRVNTNKTEPFVLRDESIEDVESVVYLGSKVTKDGGTTQDVAQRIQKANGSFVQLYPV